LNGVEAPLGVIWTYDSTTFKTVSPPRNVVAAWTGTAIITVTGRDEYGHLMVEQSASGTSAHRQEGVCPGRERHLQRRRHGATVGTGDVLGLPHYLKDKGALTVGYNDTLAADAATVVDGITTTATATTGDVRGTVVPSSAPDGAKVLTISMFFDRTSLNTEFGVPQYNAGGAE
jgi:hypothetical protein